MAVVISELALAFQIITSFFAIWIAFARNTAVAFWNSAVAAVNIFRNNPKKALAFVTLTIAFILGVVMVTYQSEAMSAIDIVYECGIYPVVQFVQAFTYTIFRVPYEYVIYGWNAVALYLRECITTAIDEIKLITNIGTLQGIVELATIIYEDIKCLLSFSINVPEISVEWLTAALRELYDSFLCYTDFFWEMLVRIATFTLVNSDCDFCRYDPTQKCFLRQNVVIDGFVFPTATCPNGCTLGNCPDCWDFVEEWYHCNGKFVNLFVPDKYPEIKAQVTKLAKNIACVTNSIIKPFFWIFSGLINTAITPSEPCVEFDDLLTGQELIPQAFDELLDCLDQLLIDLTGGALNNFIETIMVYFFNFVQEVVTTVNGFINCHNSVEVSKCFDNWPYDGVAGDNGTCQFTGSNVIPTGGIFQCFQMIDVCLKNPTNLPLLTGSTIQAVIGFIYSDIWQYGLDFVVCPFALLDSCFPANTSQCPGIPFTSIIPGLDQTICDFTCVDNNIPLLAPLASSMVTMLQGIDFAIDAIYGELNAIRQEIAAILTQVQKTFQCIGRCIADFDFDWTDCFSSNPDSGCPAKRKRMPYTLFENMTEADILAFKKGKWCENLNKFGVSKNTYCGNWLHAYVSEELQGKWTDSMMHQTCFNLFIFSAVVKSKFPEMSKSTDWLLNGELIVFTENLFTQLKLKYHNSTRELYKEKRELVEKNSNITQSIIYSSAKVISNFFKRSKRDSFSSQQLGGIRWFFTSIYDYGERVGYNALNRQYIYDTRKVKSEYDDILNSIENDPSKSPAQCKAEVAEVELIQNKVLRRMFNEHMSNLNCLRLNRHAIQFQNGTAQIMIAEKRNENSQYALTINKNNHHLMNILRVPAKGVFRKRHVEEIKQQEEFILRKTKTVKDQVQQSFDTYLAKAPTLVHLHGEFQKRGYDLFANRYFKWLHIVARTSSGNATWGDVYDYSAGRKGYIPEVGFVSVEEEKANYEKRSLYKRGSMVDVALGDYDPRSPKKFGPFLTTHSSASHRIRHSFPNGSQVGNLLRRTRYESRRTSLMIKRTGVLPFPSRHANFKLDSKTNTVSATADFNFNQLFYNWFDSFFDTDFFNSFVNQTIALGEEFLLGLQDWSESFVDELERYFTCNVPQNINGTELYNPFCFPLLPENLLDNVFVLASPNTSASQINWPSELIKRPCVNTFNGNGNLFQFVESDNCATPCPPESQFSGSLFFQPSDENPCVTNPNQCCRPFCTNPVPCDYCSRDYYTCTDAGFSDALDTLFFALAAIGSFTKTVYEDKVSYPIVDDFLVRLIFLITTVLFFVSLIIATVSLIPTFGASILLAIATFLLINFVVLAIEKWLIWTLSFLIADGIPIPLIVIVLGLALIIILSYTGLEVPNIIIIIFVVYLGSFFIFSIAQLYSDEPINLAETINPIGWLISFFTYIEDNWFLSIFFPWADDILARLEEYNYPPGTPLPPLDTFCFFYSIDSSSLLISLLFVAPFIGSFIYNSAWVLGNVLVDLWFFIFLCYDFFNVYFLRRQVEDNEEAADEMQRKIDKFQERLKQLPKTKSKISSNPQYYRDEYIVDINTKMDKNDFEDNDVENSNIIDASQIKKPKQKKMSRAFDFLTFQKSNGKKD